MLKRSRSTPVQPHTLCSAASLSHQNAALLSRDACAGKCEAKNQIALRTLLANHLAAQTSSESRSAKGSTSEPGCIIVQAISKVALRLQSHDELRNRCKRNTPTATNVACCKTYTLIAVRIRFCSKVPKTCQRTKIILFSKPRWLKNGQGPRMTP